MGDVVDGEAEAEVGAHCNLKNRTPTSERRAERSHPTYTRRGGSSYSRPQHTLSTWRCLRLHDADPTAAERTLSLRSGGVRPEKT
jgi:hypothetical protein